MMNQQSWNLPCGNKKNKRGFVLTLDALIAAVLVLVVIGATSYVAKKSNPLPNLQIIRTGSDLITLMENIHGFDSLDTNTIEGNLSYLLPENYEIKLNLAFSDSSLSQTSSLELGNPLPEKKFVVFGKRFFVVSKEGEIEFFCVVRYNIWKK